jgi:hypothetical protein
MEYLTPLENREKRIARDKKIIIGLFALLAVAIGLVPEIVKTSNPLLIRTEKGIVLSEVEPWKLSVARTEEFSRAYLSDRFAWSDADIIDKRKSLSAVTTPEVLSKLKDSLQAFEVMAHNQKARSFYVLEEFHFSNEDKKIVVVITRVLRIQSAALATPIRIEISYRDAQLTPENPYGLVVTSVDEREVVAQ